uniref:Uncharacterized protein n=1 Tax=Triticum urartu TaxID=4572 RepID=A0A8R7P5I0_TRIUA
MDKHIVSVNTIVNLLSRSYKILGILSSRYGFKGSKIISFMPSAMLWRTSGRHLHFITSHLFICRGSSNGGLQGSFLFWFGNPPALQMLVLLITENSFIG